MHERKIGRVAVTTDGLEIPLLEGFNRIKGQIFLSRHVIPLVVFGSAFVTGLVSRGLSEEERKQFRKKLELVGAMCRIARDVADGRIEGKVVRENDSTLKNPTWAEIEPRLEALLEEDVQTVIDN